VHVPGVHRMMHSRLLLRRLHDATKGLQHSVLSNGVKVISDDSMGSFAAVGVFLNTGSRFEYGKYMGCSHIIDKLSLKVH
jgi:predicted Zn-dependent peptidase